MTIMTEDVSRTDVASNAVDPNNDDDKEEKKKPAVNGETPKKHRAFGLIKVAFLAFKKRSNEKPKMVTKSAEVENWKKLVGSMRPLHLQDDDRSAPQPPPPPHPFPSTLLLSEEILSPGASPTPSYVSGGTTSQYASATNLQELDNPIESDVKEDDPDEVFDALTGDEMIDAKAEQFISQFYQQMRLQNTSASY